eukprot:NODE_8944_length_1458_cov_3.321563.p1 GENE.NODE_8944_length_1458_cov_3.321563~~NODE_8944_length_1458_cov_3.321563.p1  ORF type:complete len:416 (-),score=135.41 NODE_8944_length_1458_cov_3.321563:210-1289(-)
MTAIEADAESVDAATAATISPPTFLQRHLRASPSSPNSLVAALSLLKARSTMLKSASLAKLVDAAAADPFEKVKVLIQALVDRLQAEAAKEGTQKSWCDEQMAAESRKRDGAAEQIEAFNAKLAKARATIKKLTDQLVELNAEMDELNTQKDKAITLRGEESSENAATVEEAEEGKTAVEQAITILEEFYEDAKGATVSLHAVRPEADAAKDAPDAGFKAFEAYNGSQDDAGGVLGLLNIILSDFERTIKTTQVAEEQAKADHRQFLAETDTSLAEKGEVKAARETSKTDVEGKESEFNAGLKSAADKLNVAIKELLTLQPACVNTGMTVQERFELRKQEIDALRQALCILEKGPGADC